MLGDIVKPNPDITDWIEVDANINSLGLPVYFAVGNHDMEARDIYEERYGDTYYYFTYNNDLFIVLDPNIDGWNISGEQKDFLINVLNENASESRHIFVLFHQLLWWDRNNRFNVIYPNSEAGRADEINFWTEIEPLFNQLENKVIMLAGDVGAVPWSINVMYDNYDNITLIATGMGDAEGENFVVVNIDDNGEISYDLICLNGEIDCLGSLESHNLESFDVSTFFYNDIEIFPNPVSETGILNIKNNTGIPSHCKIYNNTGIKVLEIQISSLNEEIDFSGFKQGVYFIRFYYSNKLITKKIIKI